MSTTTAAGTYTHEAYSIAADSLAMWQARAGHAYRVSPATRSAVVMWDSLLADLLEAAHAEALDVNEDVDQGIDADTSIRTAARVSAYLIEHTTSTPTVSLRKAYVPSVAPIVGRCDVPVSTPTNLTAWDAWWFRSLLSHNGMDALQSVIQHTT